MLSDTKTPNEVIKDVVQRLRGHYTVKVNDGAGLLDGKDTYTRTFPTSPLQLEAAEIIEQQHELLLRCVPFVEMDAQMMDAITRFSPLPVDLQGQHDTMEHASVVLLRDLAKYVSQDTTEHTNAAGATDSV
jgi:hypothetical protein